MFGIYFRLSPGYFLLQEGGGIVKLICQGTNQCIFVMFPSPQPMFGIYFRLVLVIFLLQVGGRNVKFTCEGGKQCIFVMFPSPQPMYVRVPNTVFFDFAMFPRFSKSSAYVWNILQASPGYFLLQEGGGNVKLMCEGTNQCIFVMFPSPQPMFRIYFRLVLVIFLLQEGGEKCKIDMSGYQTMHICDVLKRSANVWNISG